MAIPKKDETDPYTEVDSWGGQLFQQLGESEWGPRSSIVSKDQAELGEERGWIVRKLAGESHYQIGIVEKDSPTGGRKRVFFVRTGGETIFSKDFTQSALKETLDEAIKRGPTHLPPPGKRK